MYIYIIYIYVHILYTYCIDIYGVLALGGCAQDLPRRLPKADRSMLMLMLVPHNC